MNQRDFDFKPRFFQILSEDDCIGYNLLRSKFASHTNQNIKTRCSSDFQSNLALIKNFCVRNDEDDWKRDIVCGVCWINQYIAINNSQFSILINENKSTINNSFKKLGYSIINDRAESSRLLTQNIPFFKNNICELKEWSVRRFEAETPSPGLPPFDVSTFFTFNTPKVPTNPFFSPPQSPIAFSDIPQVERPLSRPNEVDFFDDPFCLPPDFLLDDVDDNANNDNDDNGT